MSARPVRDYIGEVDGKPAGIREWSDGKIDVYPDIHQLKDGKLDFSTHKKDHIALHRDDLRDGNAIHVRLGGEDIGVLGQQRADAKARVCAEAEALARSATDFSQAGARMGELRRELASIGRAGRTSGRDFDRELEERFQKASRLLDDRRNADRQQRDQMRQAARYAKEQLIREAESLADSSDWKGVPAKFRELQTRWKQAGSTGRDVEPYLWARFVRARKRFDERHKAVLDDSRRKKESIISEASSLASSTDWKRTGDRFRELDVRWKQAGFAGREHEDTLWGRYRACKDKFFSRRKTHFDAQDRERETARRTKEGIISEAKSLANSNDWKAIGERFRSLDSRWKSAGSAGRDHEARLWQSYRAAKDAFFSRRKAYFDAQDRDRERNYHAKRALISEAAQIATAEDTRTAGQSWRSLMQRWKAIGPVGREQNDTLWNDLQNWRHQLDRRYAAAKTERINRWYQQINRLQDQRSRLQGIIYETQSRPVRPGPRAGEIIARRNAKIGSIQAKINAITGRIIEIESRIRNAR